MLDLSRTRPAEVPPDSPPVLIVVIDTEEEFDWSRPLARENTSVASIRAQIRGQEVFARHGVVPTYVVDYPVASDAAAVGILGEFARDGRCEIGAHLHPWVNPPHEEIVSPRNSYAGNLPPALERAKLECLSDTIAEAFGARPAVFRAGRYGVGPASAEILEDLGYNVDLSIVPRTDFSADGGPDFIAFAPYPYWFGRRRRLLEIPLSVGFAGRLAGSGAVLYPVLAGALGMACHAPGVAARLGLLERIRLTPEGADLAALCRLTDSLHAQGCRIFSLSFHSPSLAPGHTPYVRDEDDLRRFLDTLERYFAYFTGRLGGRYSTPARLYRWLGAQADAPARTGAAVAAAPGR